MHSQIQATVIYTDNLWSLLACISIRDWFRVLLFAAW